MLRWRALWLILALGLALRLICGLTQDPLVPYGPTGGDDPWYLATALALVTDAPRGAVVGGFPADITNLGQPPVFFLAAGLPQLLLPPGPAVQALRVVQALATTAVAFFACGLAVRLVEGLPGDSTRRARLAGLIAAGALAFSPALVLESAQVKTESLFIFFVTGGVWAYVEAIARNRGPHSPTPSPLEEGEHNGPTPHPPLHEEQENHARRIPSPVERGPGREVLWWLLAGLLLGLATLTRAVFLAFPLALVVFALFALGWRAGWKRALLLLVIYAAVVLSWTAWNLVRYQRLVIAGEGLASFVYLGATGWESPEQVDQRLTDQLGAPEGGTRDQGDYLDAAGSSIGADLPGYLARRVGELSSAILQPHNVTVYSGESLRALVTSWWTNELGPDGLAALLQGDAFWPKLLLYVVHYAGLLLGAAGIFLTWRSWRAGLPMLGYIGYTLLVHLVLLALPRYIFPITPFLWVFAAAALALVRQKHTAEGTRRNEG